ncbi:MAG TPA: histidine phosphatase family protein [Rikenellaceae bacterium]|nr:histidine phosphatase family protein [Rikenellaceae bacterium]
MKIFIIRHTESEANVGHILAGQKDFLLSRRGLNDAKNLASIFPKTNNIEMIYCSPLVRALQTAIPFALKRGIPVKIDARLIEHNIGIFEGKTYSEAENDQRYEKDRTKRWNWCPPLGESYKDISIRLQSFFSAFSEDDRDCLIITHAVTMRIIRGLLEGTLPNYPEQIPQNGEIWEVEFKGLGEKYCIKSISYNEYCRSNAE